MLQIPELLAPAGDLERLRYAINYGADAVYCSLPEFGMRSAPANFTPEQLAEGVIYAHARGRKVYLTMNTLPTNEEADRLPEAIKAAAAAGVDAFHIDVMDGHFVPNISYGAPVLKCLHAAMPDVYYDVHLMISDPARYAADFARAGASLITFHLEAVPDTAEEVIAAIRAAGCQVGISIRPGTPVEAVFPYLGVVDLILVMSVEPGFGGQKFIPTTPTRIAAICAERTRRGCDTLIEVDGGINTETGPLCIAAGVDWLVAGSSLFHAMDPAAVVNVLHSK